MTEACASLSSIMSARAAVVSPQRSASVTRHAGAVEVSERKVAGDSLERVRVKVRFLGIVAVERLAQSGIVGVVDEFDGDLLVKLLVAAEPFHGLCVIHSVGGQQFLALHPRPPVVFHLRGASEGRAQEAQYRRLALL